MHVICVQSKPTVGRDRTKCNPTPAFFSNCSTQVRESTRQTTVTKTFAERRDRRDGDKVAPSPDEGGARSILAATDRTTHALSPFEVTQILVLRGQSCGDATARSTLSYVGTPPSLDTPMQRPCTNNGRINPDARVQPPCPNISV